MSDPQPLGLTDQRSGGVRSRFRRGAFVALATALGVVVLATSPASAAEHVVKRGENLSSIARRYQVSTAELARLNNLLDPNHLLIGMRLRLPSSGSMSSKSSASRSSTSGPAIEHEPMFDLAERDQRKIARELERAAVEFGVSPSLFKALTYTESRWRQDAISISGAVGVGQIVPGTADWLAQLMDEPSLDPRIRRDNIRMSAFLLRWLLDHTGSRKAALASYYQGIGAVLRDGVSSNGARYAKVIAARRRWFD
jgi:murein DD-endopeptidase MepM/ murein hydrolase activator NlpD